MTKPLSEDEKALRAYERAVTASNSALEHIMGLHESAKDGGTGLTACSLCFKLWPCETWRYAKDGLFKMKRQLPR